MVGVLVVGNVRGGRGVQVGEGVATGERDSTKCEWVPVEANGSADGAP